VLEEYFKCFCLAKTQISREIIKGEKNIKMIRSKK